MELLSTETERSHLQGPWQGAGTQPGHPSLCPALGHCALREGGLWVHEEQSPTQMETQSCFQWESDLLGPLLFSFHLLGSQRKPPWEKTKQNKIKHKQTTTLL